MNCYSQQFRMHLSPRLVKAYARLRDGGKMCACVRAAPGGCVLDFPHARSHKRTGVCGHVCERPSKRSWRTDRERAVGIRVHAGSWAVQLAHSVSIESRAGERGRRRRRKRGWRGVGVPPDTADPVEKPHRRRKRTRNKLRGNSIKKGGCQSGLSWLPHPALCAKFQERLSPRSRVGGD